MEFGKNSGVIYGKNQEDLIRKIGSLITRKMELKQIGLKGFEVVVKKYLWTNIINDFKTIIMDLIKKKRS